MTTDPVVELRNACDHSLTGLMPADWNARPVKVGTIMAVLDKLDAAEQRAKHLHRALKAACDDGWATGEAAMASYLRQDVNGTVR